MDFLNVFSFWTVMIRMILATVLCGIIGLERSKHGRSAGMRTHILVGLGSSLAALMGYFMVHIGYASDPARIAAQVIPGIGFLGAGLILVQNKSKIVGLTTAAGLWNSAIIGLSCGLGFYEGALVCFAIAILTSLLLPKVEYWFSKNDKHTMLYMELDAGANVNDTYDAIRNSNFGEIHKIDLVSPRTGNSGHIGITLTLTLKKKLDVYSLEKELCKIDGMIFAVEL
ncbi:MAG: MgtC/SapB family protein [Clostridia bacterium]|nr:MgtC/SapB family protein [Clostridia bacterium]